MLYRTRFSRPKHTKGQPITREELVANLLGMDTRPNFQHNDPRKLHELLNIPVTTPKQPSKMGWDARSTPGWSSPKTKATFQEAARRHEDTKQRVQALKDQYTGTHSKGQPSLVVETFFTTVNAIQVDQSKVSQEVLPVVIQQVGPNIVHPILPHGDQDGGSTTARTASTRKSTLGYQAGMGNRRKRPTTTGPTTLMPEQQNGDDMNLNLWKRVAPNKLTQDSLRSLGNTVAQSSSTSTPSVNVLNPGGHSQGSQQRGELNQGNMLAPPTQTRQNLINLQLQQQQQPQQQLQQPQQQQQQLKQQQQLQQPQQQQQQLQQPQQQQQQLQQPQQQQQLQQQLQQLHQQEQQQLQKLQARQRQQEQQTVQEILQQQQPNLQQVPQQQMTQPPIKTDQVEYHQNSVIQQQQQQQQQQYPAQQQQYPAQQQPYPAHQQGQEQLQQNVVSQQQQQEQQLHPEQHNQQQVQQQQYLQQPQESYPRQQG